MSAKNKGNEPLQHRLGCVNPAYFPMPGVKAAAELLPAVYEPITEAFLKKHSKAIDHLKEEFDELGGVRLYEIEDYSIITRVPSREIINKSSKKTQEEGPIEGDFYFVCSSLIYPSPAVFDEWCRSAPGLPSTFARKLMQAAKVGLEAIEKKL